MAVKDDAKEIRQALKKRYPLTKFSVRSKPYSMGSSIRVCWLDGPTKKEIEDIAQSKKQVSYDSCGEILSGGNQFVFCDRDYSEPVYRAAVNKMRPWKNWYDIDFGAIKYQVNDDGSCQLKDDIVCVRNNCCFYLAQEVHQKHLADVSFYPAEAITESSDDDVFQIDLAEVLAARRLSKVCA
jgi:Large polyvalent protein associated domain 29